jgi:hypothetical protein
MERMLRLGSLAVLVCLLVLAGGTAHAAKPRQAVFHATLTATLTKQWTFTDTGEDGNCVRTTRGSGRWQATLKAARSARIRVTALSGGRLRFAGTLALIGGTAVGSGSSTTIESGEAPCERTSRTARCSPQRRRIARASSMLRNPRRGIAQLGSLRGIAGARTSQSACGAEPADIRAIRTDLPLATAPVDASDVFDRNVPRFYISGDTEQVTTLEGELEGRVTERVRWTVVFTRLQR